MAAFCRAFIFAFLLGFALGFPANQDLITEPKPGQEYVFVQSSGSGARPIARKDKTKEERPFETAHKLPPSLTFALNQHEEEEAKEEPKEVKKPHKREAKRDRPAPAPAGAIKLDVQKLLEKYKSEIIATTTTKPKTSSTTRKTSSRRTPSRRTKKEAKPEDESPVETTSPQPVLATAPTAPKKVEDSDDIPLVASGSEKQRSRIQIKKGPNGQEYEYEYVYYYYDDDEEEPKKSSKTASPPVSNSHDGPARRGDKKSTAPEANEVVPSRSNSKTRGRQLGEEETVNEERLPANTRFPPRSRNLNTTPLPEEEPKSTTTRSRGRGRPTTEAATSSESDNVSDETQGSRGRTRANVRRPSLELVDNASFNTHSNVAGAESSSSATGPTFPSELPAGPAEPKKEESEKQGDPAPVKENIEETPTVLPTDETTTPMSAMDKVALDLYAILQGTQKLSGEEEDNSTSDEAEATTLEATTEEVIETTTPTTTTTTTTTTTPAPTTTTTTTEAPHGRGRYRGRGGVSRKSTKVEASTTEASSNETKPKSKFGRPSFGSSKRGHHARTTPEPSVEQDAAKEESKPVSHSRPTLSRNRFSASRPRGRTTSAPNSEEAGKEESSSTSAPVAHRPSLPRTRPTFNLRARGRTTAAPSDNEASSEGSEASSEVSSTTTRTRRIQTGSAVRPLRPGPRINLSGRGRGAASSTTESPAEDQVTGLEESSSPSAEEPAGEEKQAETSAAPVDNSPLGRLRNKNRVNVQARPKTAASAPVQVRRVNPLLGRRRPGQTTEATSSEAPQETVSTEAASAESEESETEATLVSSTTTTEEPRGLNKLLAGRRRLAARQQANHS